MDRLVQIDMEQFVSRMRVQTDQMLRRVAQAVNDAPDGNVISGSEIQVRDAIRDFGRLAQEQAVQMKIDSTESSFSPSQGRPGSAPTQQGRGHAKRQHRQRPD